MSNKFKTGDLVKVKVKNPHNMSARAGAVGTVKGYSKLFGPFIQWDKHDTRRNGQRDGNYYEASLTKAKQADRQPIPLKAGETGFKVGERVVVKGSYNYEEFRGKAGKILESNGHSILVQFDTKFSAMLHDGYESKGYPQQCWYVSSGSIQHEPVKTPVIQAFDKNGKELKVGDKFTRPEGHVGGGKTFTVSEIGKGWKDHILVWAKEDNLNTYSTDVTKVEPEVAKSVNDKRFIVIVEKNGKLAPASTPKEYGSRELAQEVATKMAERHGDKFYVFESTAVATTKPVPKAELKVL